MSVCVYVRHAFQNPVPLIRSNETWYTPVTSLTMPDSLSSLSGVWRWNMKFRLASKASLVFAGVGGVKASLDRKFNFEKNMSTSLNCKPQINFLYLQKASLEINSVLFQVKLQKSAKLFLWPFVFYETQNWSESSELFLWHTAITSKAIFLSNSVTI